MISALIFGVQQCTRVILNPHPRKIQISTLRSDCSVHILTIGEFVVPKDSAADSCGEGGEDYDHDTNDDIDHDSDDDK